MKPTINKFRHYYFNRYVLSSWRTKEQYFISYDYAHRALWFRNYKVASRTIDNQLKAACRTQDYIYGGRSAYCPTMFRDYFKFAFIRHPSTRFVSAWKDKVVRENYFAFPTTIHQEMQDVNNFLTWVEQLDIDRCDEHLRSQWSLIDLRHIDFLGRFENFAQDFQHVLERLGISDTNIDHKNKGPALEIVLTAEQENRIRAIYQKDFQLFYPATKTLQQ